MSDNKPATLAITRRSMISEITRTLNLPVTQEQLDRYYAHRVLLQDAFPDLPKEDREFIKSGITAQEWKELIVGDQEGDALHEEELPDQDSGLILIPITSDTLALAIDMLWARDADSGTASRPDADTPEPVNDPDIDVDIG